MALVSLLIRHLKGIEKYTLNVTLYEAVFYNILRLALCNILVKAVIM